jgi:hypothetical protein
MALRRGKWKDVTLGPPFDSFEEVELARFRIIRRSWTMLRATAQRKGILRENGTARSIA